ncbi:ribulokinase (plasmid) [Saccharobesus litoralis]|uniref:Ribulokinase n=1 Tax=Saccharobesus litoralis TaxID=2172099 RepID=A0A2S0VYJ0_9ALTE|nr:ribulokinase [Saccharobesus litoralis]AWB69252.1 ribulokinase [Saccharobesus litoralis]
MTTYTLGLDYGSDSVRALLVDTASGQEVATHVVYYPRWREGLYCEPSKDQFRQHPLDYVESLVEVVNGLWQQVPAETAKSVVGMSFDTTGSTPVALDAQGTALALKPEFAENPHAMFVLWKDHTAVKEALEITAAAQHAEVNYVQYEGGIYSSEWYWAKVLHNLRADTAVREATYMWVEHCDWMSALVTGTTHPEAFRASRCAAGHKLMWHESWGGYPPNEFFKDIDPLLDGLSTRLPADTFTADQVCGYLSSEWATKLGLSTDVAVTFSAFDCHAGAVGANVKPGVLTKVMGTSTCDITVATAEAIAGKAIRGICGQVNGSVMPGLVGLEAGQSAFGDLYAWFKNLINWPLNHVDLSDSFDAATKAKLIDAIESKTLFELDKAASQIAPGQTGITALDWVNGRRTPDADQTVAMAITGLKMGSDAPAIYRALIEATVFGAKAIIDRFVEEGVEINSVVTIGGISKKSDLIMQICADVWNCEIAVLESDQSCALGGAIYAAAAAGIYPDVASAQQVMASPVCKTFTPQADQVAIYQSLYQKYLALAAYVDGGKQ